MPTICRNRYSFTSASSTRSAQATVSFSSKALAAASSASSRSVSPCTVWSEKAAEKATETASSEISEVSLRAGSSTCMDTSSEKLGECRSMVSHESDRAISCCCSNSACNFAFLFLSLEAVALATSSSECMRACKSEASCSSAIKVACATSSASTFASSSAARFFKEDRVKDRAAPDSLPLRFLVAMRRRNSWAASFSSSNFSCQMSSACFKRCRSVDASFSPISLVRRILSSSASFSGRYLR
mmetsp:Transcript_43116/g.123311  ORF Transcript_43116/g.123311 Transcript_43116/m.123311 type:complete len:243 (+) Transcript_43116:733-1461(+)